MSEGKARSLILGDAAQVLAGLIAAAAPDRSAVMDAGGNVGAVVDLLPATGTGARIVLALGLAERVAPEQTDLLLNQLCDGATHIVFAASAPGQEGDRLVNCQWPSHWVQAFAARGFAAQDILRRTVWDDERFPIWCRQNLLLFVRGDAPTSAFPSHFDLVHPHMFRQTEARAEALARENQRLLDMGANRRPDGVSAREAGWCRVVMNQETRRLMRTLDYANLACLEVSGHAWQDFGFKEYSVAGFPEFDITRHVARRADGQGFDVIIAEQVLNHVPTPWVGITTMREGLNPGGHLLVTTPLFIRLDAQRHDYTRWTQSGLRNLFEYTGFAPENVVTGSWGNRDGVNAGLSGPVHPAETDDLAIHLRDNEPDMPIMVWAFARK